MMHSSLYLNGTLDLSAGAVELGALGAQLCTHFLTNWQLKQAFKRKKNFENPSKIDRVRQKCKLRTHFPAASAAPLLVPKL